MNRADSPYIATKQDLIGVKDLQATFHRDTVGLSSRGFLTYQTALSELYDSNQ